MTTLIASISNKRTYFTQKSIANYFGFVKFFFGPYPRKQSGGICPVVNLCYTFGKIKNQTLVGN